MTFKRVAVLGATRGMGRAVARRFAERGDWVAVMGRQKAELERSAADLRARGAGGRIVTARCDLEHP